MRILVILAVVGQLTRIFAVAFVPPTLYALAEGLYESMTHFLIALATTLLSGLLFAPFLERNMRLRRAEALATVAITWLVVGFCGALPYMLGGMSLVDAVFESISGFTTTGATAMADFTIWDRSIFLWRSMTQWFGGLGIIALFVIVLPGLGIAGRQLFFAESAGAPGETLSPQVRHAAMRLWLLYLGLTALMTLLLVIFDVPLYDAICHALTTLPAGGFSPHPQGVMGYGNPAMEWIVTVFMFISGMSFPLLYVTLVRRPLALVRDGEFLLYSFAFIALSAGSAWLLYQGGSPTGHPVLAHVDTETALRLGMFQVASIMSSTGLASTDYNLWNDGARALIILAMLIGGCAGSAAGGPKVVRYLLLFKHILREFARVLHPRAIASIRFKGQNVSDDTMRAMLSLIAIFMGTYVAVGTLFVLDGKDIITGFTAAVATVGNIGPGLNEVGPMGSFAGFSDFSKVVATAGMWIGRLEIVTVLALFQAHVLRNLHWRRFKV
jgi:trk system potassium uptake protein TrkH